MALIPVILGAIVAGLAAGWLADVVLRRLSRSTLAAPAAPRPPVPVVPLPLHLVDPALDRCWLCSPTPDPGRYDGQPCPTCRLLADVFPDHPIPYWPTEGEAT
ncbi:hypothetical protein [Embleya sp. NPDC059237]|uniref:hypothetical protein n=1 Tax=Embleya sp. NPDC059237 TaxID=3346784 RepID=UPI0036B5F942